MRTPIGFSNMPLESVACNACGISTFLTRAGLYSHQRHRCRGKRTVPAPFIRRANSIPRAVVVPEKSELNGAPVATTSPRAVRPPEQGVLHRAGDAGSRQEPSPALDAVGLGASQPCPNIWVLPSPVQGDGIPLHPFDSNFHLINFVRNCKKKQGLSREDIKALLDLLLDDRFDPKALTIRNPDDVEKYEERELYSSSDGWRKYTFAEVTTGDADLYYKDPIQVLTSLFSAPENGEDFRLGPTCHRTQNGERIFSTPDTGYWWSHMQEYMNVECNGATLAPLIFYSDQTSLSNNTRVNGYPLVMTIGNISIANRREEAGHELLAILPTFRGSNVPYSKRLEYFHEGLNIIFKPLKEASTIGLPLLDPYAAPHIVYPLLFAYICDHPESCKITASYDTNLSACPCSRCMCGRDALGNTDRQFQLRTESKMKEVYKAMKGLPPNLADELSKTWSLHPVQCALWGFKGGDTAMGNPYLAIHVDILHQSDLGVFKMIIGIIRDMASTSPRERKLEELDRRLHYIKQKCRFPAFRIPGNEQGGYFVSQANFAGFEHRAVLQVVVLCLVGLFDESIISAIVLFLDWYSVACRSSSHTRTSLQHMDALMYRAVEALKGTMLDWQRSGFNTSKVHMMSHFSPCIQRSGLPWEYSTDMYEQFHIALMKSAYRSSNKRVATPQIIRHNMRLQSLRKASKQIAGVQHSVKVLETPLKKAMKMGQNVMCPIYANVHRLWFHRQRSDFSQTSRATPQDIQNGRGYGLARVSMRIQKLLEDQPEIPQELCHALKAYEICMNVTISQVLGLSRSLGIPPGSGEKYGDWPMYARATSSFHGRPYFSNVAFEVDDGSCSRRTCYGQIRLLLQAKCDSSRPFAQQSSQLQLAFLKLYTEIDDDSWSVVTKCKSIRWALQSSVLDVQNSMRRNSEAHLRGRYVVIDIQRILRVVHVIPNFVVQGRFFVNRWKF